MLGWGRRKDAQAVEAMREQLAAADMHARSVLAAVAQTDSRWSKDREDRARVQLSTEGTLERMTASAAANTADITRSLHHIAEMCSLVAQKLEADRMERSELTAAINELKRLLSSPLETPSQVLGGMVYSSQPPAAPATEIARNGDAPRNGEYVVNGTNGTANGNGNGNGYIANGNGAHADEIRLSDYEDEPVSPFGTVEANRPAVPFQPVDLVEPAASAEPEPAERFGRWDAVPPPRTAPTVAVVETPAPPAPAPVVEPPRQYDAFAGLPLLAPAEPPRTFGTVVSPPAPAEPQVVEQAVVVEPAVVAAEPEVVDGLDRQWSDSHRLTETNSFRPQGGTRLTPRRSSTPTSSR